MSTYMLLLAKMFPFSTIGYSMRGKQMGHRETNHSLRFKKKAVISLTYPAHH